MSGLSVILAVIVISLIMSTKEGRAAAREKMRPFARKLLVPVLLLWGFILWAGFFGPR